MKIAIYGAEPKAQLSPALIGAIAHVLKRARAFRRDAAGLLAGNLAGLDYRNYLSPSTINQGDLAIAQSVERFIVEHNPKTTIELIRWGELDQYEATWSDFVIAGGGYIMIDNIGHLPKRIIDDIVFFQRYGIRPILFGIGFNYPKIAKPESSDIAFDQATEATLRELLSISKAISVRDRFTQTTLSRYTDKKINLVGDPALHFGSLYGIQHIDKPSSQDHPPLVGLNLNFHGPSSTKLLQKNLLVFAAAIQGIRDQYHCDFRYFSHFDTDLVIPKLLALKGIKVEVVHGSPEVLVRGYAELDLQIGGMLHSCILAHSVDTPTIALAYDIKHRGFMELFGLERNCLSAAELTAPDLIEHVCDVLSDLTSYRKTISATRSHFERITQDFLEANFDTP